MDSRLGRTLGLLLALLWLAGGGDRVYGSEVEHPILVTVEKNPGNHFTIRGTISGMSDREAAWSALTDYEGMARWISMMRLSRIIEQTPEGLRVEQRSVGDAYFLKAEVHLLLNITEVPFTEIRFEDTLGESFTAYAGSWRIVPGVRDLSVRYEVRMERPGWVPAFLLRAVFAKNAEALLLEVRQEILKRSGKDPVDG